MRVHDCGLAAPLAAAVLASEGASPALRLCALTRNRGTGVGFVERQGVLIEIDPATGSGGIIGPIVVGLEIASDGFLLGSIGGADPMSGGLLRIDPATGASTFVGFTGFSPVSGLTKLP